ncbi:M23 family metallopeptidase [Phragmitibacter flavus]|uniref:M23 family metallopeptidase n=1 Tax=Phragmitibacter flavus TaxID=2576071 RepID=UPI00140E342C|nr:M23 family metallopeptidase [Phragmitibacter flavus]
MFILFALSTLATPLHAVDTVRCQLADGFDFPVGKPDAAGYYKARGFWPNGHLGEDWNGTGGGDSDLGDPIYNIGHGVVVLSEDVKVGWGNVIIIRHAYREPNGKIEIIDALHGHLLERKVKVGDIVERGQLIGTMGGNNGMYPVHLHFEIRKNLTIGMNRSKFARDYSNYHSPTPFINARRQLASDFKRYEIPVNTFAAYGGELSDSQSGFNIPSPNLPNAPGVRRTSRGLSIPVTGGTGYSPNSNAAPGTSNNLSRPGTTGSNTGIAPPPSNATGSQEDFWSRLKSKLSKGEVTPGADAK